MEVTLARSAGFCFGVARAVHMAEELAASGGPAKMLGHIIHNDHEIARLAALVVLLAAYALLLQKLGFIICSLIMIEASLLLFGQRKPLWLIVIPVGFTGLIYVIFRFALKILLPTIWLP